MDTRSGWDGIGAGTRTPDRGPGPAGRLTALVRGRLGGYHRVAGVLLVVLWVTWLVVTVVVQPRSVSERRFDADLRAGSITSWAVVGADRDDSRTWSGGFDIAVAPRDQAGEVIRGEVSGALTLWYATDAPIARWRVVDPSEVVGVRALEHRLGEAGVARATGESLWAVETRPERAQSVGFVTGVLFLGLLLFGPRPTRGTRWFWFWFLWVSMGVGVLVYAVAEHLRRLVEPGAPVGRPLDVFDGDRMPDDPPPEVVGDPDGREGDDLPMPRRRSGFLGFGMAIVLSFLVSVPLSVLIESAGVFWLPSP